MRFLFELLGNLFVGDFVIEIFVKAIQKKIHYGLSLFFLACHDFRRDFARTQLLILRLRRSRLDE